MQTFILVHNIFLSFHIMWISAHVLLFLILHNIFHIMNYKTLHCIVQKHKMLYCVCRSITNQICFQMIWFSFAKQFNLENIAFYNKITYENGEIIVGRKIMKQRMIGGKKSVHQICISQKRDMYWKKVFYMYNYMFRKSDYKRYHLCYTVLLL